MKNSIIILFILWSGQSSFGQIFTVGAKAGIQGMTTSYHDSDVKELYNTGYNAGYNFGGFIEFPLPDDFSLVGEFSYSAKGRNVKYNESFQNKASYKFLDIPILLRKSFPLRSDGFTSFWFFNIGPDISYWTSGNGKLGSRTYDVVFSELGDVVKFQKMHLYDVNRFMFGLNFGIGYTAMILGNQRFFVESRFMYGHTDFGQEDSAYINILGFEDDMRASLRLLNLSFGYGITVDLHDAKKGKSTMDRVRKKKRR